MNRENINSKKSGSGVFVHIIAAVSALGGLLFGYDTGVISGAILFIQKRFMLSATLEGIVVSSVLAGAVIGAVVGGKIMTPAAQNIPGLGVIIVFHTITPRWLGEGEIC